MSAQQGSTLGVLSFVSSTNLSATTNVGKLVVASATEGMIELANATADEPVGVLQNMPPDQTAAQVTGVSGAIYEVVSDGSGTSIAIGDWLGVDSSARVVKAETDNYIVVGQALQGSQTANLKIEVQWHGARRY
jgi:hypothetical protein